MTHAFRTVLLASILGLSVLLQSATATASHVRLSTELLSAREMPSGWSLDVQTGGTLPGCLSRLFEPAGVRQTSHATINFIYNGALPLVSEKLGTYSNAATAYRSIVATLADCDHISGVSGKQKVTGTIAKLRVPSYANTSAAFAAKLDIQGTAIANDIVIVRKGNVVIGVEEANSGFIKVNQLERFVSKALSKVR